MPKGGKRPGAGRPRKVVKDWQAANLAVLQSVFSASEIRQIAEKIREDLKAGDADARRVALPYLFGPAPKELALVGDADAPLRIELRWPEADGGDA